MIYTSEMRKAVRSVSAPHGFVVDFMEYDMYPPFIGLRFYQSQWDYYSETERLACIEYLIKLRNIFTGFGIKTTLDPIADDGQNLPTREMSVR